MATGRNAEATILGGRWVGVLGTIHIMEVLVGWGRVMGCGALGFFHDKDGGEGGRTGGGGGGGEVGAE